MLRVMARSPRFVNMRSTASCAFGACQVNDYIIKDHQRPQWMKSFVAANRPASTWRQTTLPPDLVNRVPFCSGSPLSKHVSLAHFRTSAFCREDNNGKEDQNGSDELTEAEFDRLADDMLERLCEDLEELEPSAGEDFEIDYAMGVLTLVLDKETTYVLNKQRPNRQVWLSSPMSGPRRFELDTACLKNPTELDAKSTNLGWNDIRNKEQLAVVLQDELYKMTGVELSLLDEE